MCTIRVQSPNTALQFSSSVVRKAALCEAVNDNQQPSRTATADMKFQALLFLALLICTSVCVAQGSYGNCCLGHVRGMREKGKKNIESYRMQETDGDCNIRAVVFTMKKRSGRKTQRTVCAHPDHIWVQELMEVVRLRMRLQN